MAIQSLPFFLDTNQLANKDAGTFRGRIAAAKGLSLAGLNVGLTLKVRLNHITGFLEISFDDTDVILAGKGLNTAIINTTVRQWNEYISG